MNSKNDIASSIQQPQQNAQQGYTIAELMIVLSIVGVLAALAAPSFSKQLASQRNKSSTSNWTAIMAEARSESVIRRENMNVTFIDNTKKIELTDGKSGEKLSEYTLNEDSTITMNTIPNSASSVTSITFKSNKTVEAQVKITVCDSLNDSADGREINVSTVGIVTVKGVPCS